MISKTISNSVLSFLQGALILMLISLHPLITSTCMQMVPETGVRFFVHSGILLVIYLLILILIQTTNPAQSKMAFAVLLLTFQLQTANFAMLPLLYYTSGLEYAQAQEMAELCTEYTFLFLISFLAAWIIMIVAPFLLTSRKKIFPIFSAVLNLVIAFALIFLNDGVRTTMIHNIQVGIPLLAYLFLIFSYYYRIFIEQPESCGFTTHRKAAAGMHYASFGMILAGYLVCSEIGIPAYFVFSVLIWFWFYLRRKSRLSFWIITGMVAAVLAAAAGYYLLIYLRLEEDARYALDAHLHGLGTKIHRIFSEVPQTITAEKLIRSAGFFGNVSYRYLAEGKSDFSLTLITHYLGCIWMALLIILVCLTAVLGNEYWKKRKLETECPLLMMPYLSFTCIVAICLYNILGNLGIMGIIGVSCYASGYGKTIYILSGALLGFTLYQSKLDEMLKQKISSLRERSKA
ncbi:MAG: hypothetical protein E7496_05550 [Ruminococcus sp.]|nr:hypothetical protein [Ruminococcus sp.]